MSQQSITDSKEAPTSSRRYDSLDPQRVLSMMPILTYHVIADIGCGTGYFTIPLGKYVFTGKVYALDTQQEMVDATQEELKRVRLTNVEPRLYQENKLPLEDESLDGVFAALAMHKAGDPKALLQEGMRCMRKGAWLTLIEWHKRATDGGPLVKERIDEARLLKMATDVGLRLTSRHDLNDKHYMLLMRK